MWALLLVMPSTKGITRYKYLGSRLLRSTTDDDQIIIYPHNMFFINFSFEKIKKFVNFIIFHFFRFIFFI